MAGSTTTIVQAVALLLRTGVSPALVTVYDYRPVRDPQGDELPGAWVWCSRQQEYRHGLGGGPNLGKKHVEHTIDVDFRWFTHKPEDAALGQAAWQDMLDSVRARLRPNQTLTGATGVTVLRAFEDMALTVDPPEADGTTIDYHAHLSTTVLEEFTG